MAATVIALYPLRKKIAISAAVYALYIGLGVSVTIHWFSDFIAGAIIGTVIGLVVATSYRKRARLFSTR
jgi:membrane-associated phospholipid phosphatase